MEPDVSPSQVFVEAGARILLSSGGVQDGLNQALNQHLPWPFRAATASVRDIDGGESEVFGTVISAGGLDSDSVGGTAAVSSDNAACVINVNESLDAKSLCAAYGRIASAKRPKKTAAKDLPGVVMTTVTLGIVLAREATLPMEQLAEELDRLNRTHPDREWTDMVVVLSKGIINYAVQFPGEGVTGDFLPPVADAGAILSAHLRRDRRETHWAVQFQQNVLLRSGASRYFLARQVSSLTGDLGGCPSGCDRDHGLPVQSERPTEAGAEGVLQ